jgi:hypothetical protein
MGAKVRLCLPGFLQRFGLKMGRRLNWHVTDSGSVVVRWNKPLPGSTSQASGERVRPGAAEPQSDGGVRVRVGLRVRGK